MIYTLLAYWRSLLDRFIERQAQRTGADEANATAALWAASERKHLEKRREEHRLAWIDFHRGQAERLRRTMMDLVAKHEAGALKLMEPLEKGETA